MTTKPYVIQGHSGRPITIDINKPDVYNSMIVFVHGFKGFKDWGTHDRVSRYFAEQRFAFLKFNFSHNGTTPDAPQDFSDLETFGRNTFTKELYDLNQVVAFALSGKEFPAPEKINIIGHSRGGGISIIHTSEDERINKLITWASVSNFKSLWMSEQEENWRREKVIYVENTRTKQQMPLYIELLHDLESNFERLNILSAAEKVGQPWLIIHAEGDTTVPLSNALELSSKQEQNNLYIISDSDHVFGARHPWTEERLPEELKRVCDASISFLKA